MLKKEKIHNGKTGEKDSVSVKELNQDIKSADKYVPEKETELNKYLTDLKPGDNFLSPAQNLSDPFENDPRRKYLFEVCMQIASKKLLIYVNRSFFFFNSVYYEPYDENRFNGVIYNILVQNKLIPIGTDVNFIVNNLKVITTANSYDMQPNEPTYFLYNNVIIGINGGPIMLPTPDYFATGAINADFSPEYKFNHPEFDTFLNRITGGDKVLILRIWQFIAYVLSPAYHLRKIFCLIGVGGAGNNGFVFAGDDAYCEFLADRAAAATTNETMRVFSENMCVFNNNSFTTTENLYAAYNQAFPSAPYGNATAFSRDFYGANIGKVNQTRKHTAEPNLRGFEGVEIKEAAV